MSAYQRFIESSARKEDTNKTKNFQKQTSIQMREGRNYSNKLNNNPNQIMATIIKTPQIFTSKVNLNITSTPISKQQYKRLVEADQLAIKQQQHEQWMSQNRQQSSGQMSLLQSQCLQSQASSIQSPTQLKLHYAHLNPQFTSPDPSLHQQQQQQPRMQESQQHYQVNQQQQLQHNDQSSRSLIKSPEVKSLFETEDPVLLQWLKAMRFETELECLTSLITHSLAKDEYSASALSIRNSQVVIQEMRLQSDFTLDFIDSLIEMLPLQFNSVSKFAVVFSELWNGLVQQTAPQMVNSDNHTTTTTLAPSRHHNPNNNQQITIINCTPRKSQTAARQMKPKDVLANKLRSICINLANQLYIYQENPTSVIINNEDLEANLRRIKELYGKFIEISIRFECANIVRGLYYDFSQTSLNRLSSTSSLHPTRPFESSSSQLPVKWSLIALWQLTKDDSYLCRLLTEKWRTVDTSGDVQNASPKNSISRVAKRLDYSTKYDSSSSENENHQPNQRNNNINIGSSLRSEYEQLYRLTMKQDCNMVAENQSKSKRSGALSGAIKNITQQPITHVSTIEFLIDIIISQPNKHERVDMLNFIHSEAQHNKLIQFDEWDQNISAAVYTSNQYKVAALRILNHLCINEQAVRTILKCFSTPPPNPGQPIPENKIIRSIFECYQTAQEHIYQNETMFHQTNYYHGNNAATVCQRGRKRTRQVDEDEYSDYGSRQTPGSQQTSLMDEQQSSQGDEKDDVVVKEAIRLLVQLTTPFHRSSQGLDFYTLIGRFSIDSLVRYLTNIISSSTSREMLFLSLTALANISFITTEPMKLYGTNRVMLEMFRTSKSRSKDLELRDQAVTILANTAEENLSDIVNSGGLTFLVSCLESCPTKMYTFKQLFSDRYRRDPLADNGSLYKLNIENKPRNRKPIDFREDFPDVLECACDEQNIQNYQLRQDMSPNGFRQSIYDLNQQPTNLCLSKMKTNDLAALERIHQKTAVAFARMSVDPSTTKMVLKYGGIKQMIDLCKFSHKRNHSDTVLIACLAALRKMANVIDSETFKYYNALDLIELDMNRALEIYGNNQDNRSSFLNSPHAQPQQHSRLFTSDV